MREIKKSRLKIGLLTLPLVVSVALTLWIFRGNVRRKKRKVSNDINTNQHYITESFVKKRFGTNGFVERYDVEHDKWKPNASPRFVFSGEGYTQLLIEGQSVDNSLEKAFNKAENELQNIFPVLDDAATRPETKVPNEVFNNLCFYLSYLWYLSPFAKAKAPADTVMELDKNLENGNWQYLSFTGISDETAKGMLEKHKQGAKWILKGENYLQFLFRVRIFKGFQNQAEWFRYETKWTVYNSPIELPISDIALIDYSTKDVVLYILPISPQSVLIGKFWPNKRNTYKEAILYGDTLSLEEATYIREYICLSAVKAIACKNRMDIKGIREEVNQKGISFTKIVNLENVLKAGSKVFNIQNLHFIAVGEADYRKFVHSFIQPPNLKPPGPNITQPKPAQESAPPA